MIMESLSAGTPVLIADTTPWHHLEQAGVGWDVPLDDEQRFIDKIHDAGQISGEEYAQWRERVLSYAHRHTANPEAIAANRQLFLEAIA